ncbi:MAG: AMP-binding protein, partial [Pseudomonadota bacterium]
MNPALWLTRSAVVRADAPALHRGTECVSTYAGFAGAAAAVAGALRNRYAIAPGDRVAIFSANSPEYLEALYGIWFAGAAAVPINAKLHVREAAWIIGNAGARVVFSSARLQDELREAVGEDVRIVALDGPVFAEIRRGERMAEPHPVHADDLVWLFYTSGTTGRPKGVMITAGNVMAMALGHLADVDSMGPDDAALYAAPISHGAGLYNFMHVMRATPHIVPASGGFGAAEIFAIARKIGSICMFAAHHGGRRE